MNFASNYEMTAVAHARLADLRKEASEARLARLAKQSRKAR